ncbi:hypothetical protein FB451DRAFT_1190555 [Mycena latifolia]|nr:hypothetical protein FB451DRAFT_1190555 [Mycena latifolia]
MPGSCNPYVDDRAEDAEDELSDNTPDDPDSHEARIRQEDERDFKMPEIYSGHPSRLVSDAPYRIPHQLLAPAIPVTPHPPTTYRVALLQWLPQRGRPGSPLSLPAHPKHPPVVRVPGHPPPTPSIAANALASNTVSGTAQEAIAKCLGKD